ncbi:MAG: hypothetical protein MUF27_12450 [Acidobacteria bacterium]|jgi:hypothetical protein|nr:hypothetical protein [Acidobacteriota bacterium]
MTPAGRLARTLAALAASAAALLATALSADGLETVVVLKDGQRIPAVSATRDGDVVEIQLATGDMLSYPASSIASIELSTPPPPPPPPPPISGPALNLPPAPPPGENKPISGPALNFPKPPKDGPKPISGPEIQPTTIAQQQAVFTSPYQPQAPIIDPTWQPTSAYDKNADVLADSRTQWSKPIIDPTWTPTPAYDSSADVLADNRTQWSKPIIDSSWQPTNAFSQ